MSDLKRRDQFIIAIISTLDGHKIDMRQSGVVEGLASNIVELADAIEKAARKSDMEEMLEMAKHSKV